MKTHQKVEEQIYGSMVDVPSQIAVVSYGNMEELGNDGQMVVEEKCSGMEVVVMENKEVKTYSSKLEVVGTLMEEEGSFSNKEAVERGLGEAKNCRRTEVAVKEMEVTCRYREEEAMEMGVVEICTCKEGEVKEVGVVICRRKEVGVNEMEEVMTYRHKEEEVKEIEKEVTCKHREEVVMEMEEVVTCRYWEEEVMEMGVVEICKCKEEEGIEIGRAHV